MKREKSMMRTGALVLLGLAVLTVAGCISVRSDVTYGPSGPAVRRETLRQVEVGATSKEWLLGVLGTPTRTSRTPDGTDILTYEYTRKIDTDLDFCIFFNLDDRRDEFTTYIFELEDGVVTKYWCE